MSRGKAHDAGRPKAKVAGVGPPASSRRRARSWAGERERRSPAGRRLRNPPQLLRVRRGIAILPVTFDKSCIFMSASFFRQRS